MKPIKQVEGKVAPLDRANVDTDAIIPKQYLKSIKRTGFGAFLFDDWRYLDSGDLQTDPASRRPNPEFVLNDARYANAVILLARENFGCGSSREHAVWALKDYGLKAIIAPSFAEIFYNNCFKNGLLPIVLNNKSIGKLFEEAQRPNALKLQIDLPGQTVVNPADGASYDFEIEDYRKKRLLLGLDDIALTLEHADAIRAYEARRAKATPWLF